MADSAPLTTYAVAAMPKTGSAANDIKVSCGEMFHRNTEDVHTPIPALSRRATLSVRVEATIACGSPHGRKMRAYAKNQRCAGEVWLCVTRASPIWEQQF